MKEDIVIKYNVYSLINEIKNCRINKFYLSSLALALTLPDICSKLIDNNSKQKNREIYSKWIRKWTSLSNYEPDIEYFNEEQICYMKLKDESIMGNIIYDLRCSILHNGQNELYNIKHKTFKIDKFILKIKKGIAPLMVNGRISNSEKSFHHIRVEISLDFLLEELINSTIRFLEINNIYKDNLPVLEIKY